MKNTVNEIGKELELRTISVDSLTITPNHPRRDLGDLTSLEGSTRKDGVIEPLLVNETDSGRLDVCDGTRRLGIAKGFGWKEIQCLVIKGLSEEEAARLSYIKNNERKTLSAIEMARFYQAMRLEYNYTLDELELKGCGSKAHISSTLKLLELPDGIQSQVQAEIITAGHAKAITKLSTKEEQLRMAKKIVDFDLTVAQTENRINRYLAKKRKASTERPTAIIPSVEIPGVYFTDAKDMDKYLPKGSVHLVVTSPNYLIGMEFEKGITMKDHLVNVQEVMAKTSEALVPGGIIALNVADIAYYRGNAGQSEPQTQLMGHIYQNYLKKEGVYLTGQIIWAKRPAWGKLSTDNYRVDTVHTSYRVYNNWEPVYIFRKKGEREIPSDDVVLKSRLTREQWISYMNGVWPIEPVRNNLGHPCMFPDELVSRLIQMYSYVGDTVLDPFLGSATVLKIARELGRVGIGFERELQYKPVIMKKLGISSDQPVEKPKTILGEFVEKALSGEIDDSDFPSEDDSNTSFNKAVDYLENDPSEAKRAEVFFRPGFSSEESLI